MLPCVLFLRDLTIYPNMSTQACLLLGHFGPNNRPSYTKCLCVRCNSNRCVIYTITLFSQNSTFLKWTICSICLFTTTITTMFWLQIGSFYTKLHATFYSVLHCGLLRLSVDEGRTRNGYIYHKYSSNEGLLETRLGPIY